MRSDGLVTGLLDWGMPSAWPQWVELSAWQRARTLLQFEFLPCNLMHLNYERDFDLHMDLLQSAIKAYKDASFFLTIYDILYNIHIIRSNRLDTVCCRLHKFNWKEIMYRSDWPLRQWLQTPSVAICRTCLSSCTLAMLASSNSKCLCFSQRCLKRHPNWHWLHTHTHIFLRIFTIYK